MYYIYHIPDVKIGCTSNLKKRIRDQGNVNYEILEQHTCIDTASKRELQLQKEYGYPVDKIPYWKSLNMQTFESRSKGGKTNVQSGQWKEFQKLGVRAAELKNRKPVIQYDLEGSYVAEWISAADAENKLGVWATSITRVCNGKRKTAGGFIWKYKKNPK